MYLKSLDLIKVYLIAIETCIFGAVVVYIATNPIKLNSNAFWIHMLSNEIFKMKN